MEKTGRVSNKTIPLPLEIDFFPASSGIYDATRATVLDENQSLCSFGFISGIGPNASSADAWVMRKEFLDLEENSGGLTGITLAYGRLGIGNEDLTVPIQKLGNSFVPVEGWMLLQSEFREWQLLIRAAMTRDMQEWPSLHKIFSAQKVNMLCRALALKIKWSHRKPTGIIACYGVLQALIATLHVDALLGAEYRFCACVGCGKGFEVTRRDQRYCPDSDCKHRQVVRNGRERKRKSAQVAREQESKMEEK